MFEELLDIYRRKAEEMEKERKEAQAMVVLVTAVEKLSRELTSRQNDVEVLGKLIEQVDRLSKEVADLKSQVRARQGRMAHAKGRGPSEKKALDIHARTLIEILSERPGRYTTSELVDMLGLNKTTVISVMKRALEIDPKHIRMTQGKRRKLYLAYVSDEDAGRAEAETGSGEADRARLELMAMT